jgi:hypothetical protein
VTNPEIIEKWRAEFIEHIKSYEAARTPNDDHRRNFYINEYLKQNQDGEF